MRRGSRAEETKQWFKRPDEVITRYGIGASEIWNADQAGIRVGILRERVQCPAVRTNKKAATEATPPERPLRRGLSSKPFQRLEVGEYRRRSRDAVCTVRYSVLEWRYNARWARDFNRKSWDKSAAVQHRQLDFEEWFGCNEHLKSPSNAAASYDKPPGTEGKAEEDLVWRLLVIDGFSGHGSFAFENTV
ncbi:hypothetical protein FOMA001_g10549 [Fusarium oxysporum f. sp. matthiolae]|nr:hypothetical protein FOMA001_g10549 [Fusarium oxysporum f. sp. matthiolae]